MTDKYILVGHDAVPERSLMKWAKWFEKAERIVAKSNCGGVFVSTVFLGINHQFGEGLPLLFETMVFGENMMERYSTWDEAVNGHERMCQKVRKQLAKSKTKTHRD